MGISYIYDLTENTVDEVARLIGALLSRGNFSIMEMRKEACGAFFPRLERLRFDSAQSVQVHHLRDPVGTRLSIRCERLGYVISLAQPEGERHRPPPHVKIDEESLSIDYAHLDAPEKRISLLFRLEKT